MVYIQWFNSLTDFYKFFPFILFYSAICILYFFDALFYNSINEKNSTTIDYDQNITKRSYSEYWDLLIILCSYQIHHSKHVIYLESIKHVLFQRITKILLFQVNLVRESRLSSFSKMNWLPFLLTKVVYSFFGYQILFDTLNQLDLHSEALCIQLWKFLSLFFSFLLSFLLFVLFLLRKIQNHSWLVVFKQMKSLRKLSTYEYLPRIIIFEHLLFQSFLARCFP